MKLIHNIENKHLTHNIRMGYKSVAIPGVTGDELVTNGDFHDFGPTVDANTIALWRFDDVYHQQEATGKTALQDLSGNGHDLTPSVGFDWTNSFVAGNPSYKNGNGLKFDGVDDYGQTNNTVIPGLTGFTITATVKTNSSFIGRDYILDSRGVNGSAPGFGVFIDPSNVAGFVHYSDGSYTEVHSNNLLPDTFYHIVITVDRDGYIKIYINGQFNTNASISHKSGDDISTNVFRVGDYGGSADYYFNHSMFDLSISNGVLTPKEIQESYALAKGWNWDGVGSISNSSFRQVVSGGGKVTQQVATVAGTQYEQVIESVGAGIVTTGGQDGDHVVTLQDDTYINASVKNQAIEKTVDPSVTTNIVYRHLIHNLEAET